MEPAPVEQCRMLELGCGEGSNMLAMAYAVPESTFVGVDIASEAIKAGTARIERLGLTNYTLHALDLAALDEGFGTFDYIVAHGVYSWVPEPVRDRLMATCKALLAPHGVAYISYNVYPGYYQRQAGREIMRYHTRHMDDEYERTRQGRSVLHLAAEGYAAEEGDPYQQALRQEFERLDATSNETVLHSALADVNNAFYVHEFAGHAARHGLQFLAEAEYVMMQDHIFNDEARSVLQQLAGRPVEREQYIDFLLGRKFRQTLLCHEDVALRRPPRPASVAGCYAGGAIRQVPVQGEAKPGTERFKGIGDHREIQTSHPISKAVFHTIGDAWPRYVAFEELLDLVREVWEREGDAPVPEQADEILGAMLLDLYGDRFLSLHTYQPSFTTDITPRPEASAVARLQAEVSRIVTNRVHYSVQLRDDAERRLMRLLDGTREAPDLVEAVNAGRREDEEPVDADWLWDALERFAERALLVA
jgi:methyltransferase-like protein/cyclopropane fatty-acyl-phospholipid synthase-like methyltransferase